MRELSNHLGNVLATVSDKKIAVMSGANLSYYRADVVSYSDYYPFGAPMTERTAVVTPTDVRYGFQGQEEDDELWNGAVSFDNRILDSRLARFFSIDPLFFETPYESPFSVSSNSPIVYIDEKGLQGRPPRRAIPKPQLQNLRSSQRAGYSHQTQQELKLSKVNGNNIRDFRNQLPQVALRAGLQVEMKDGKPSSGPGSPNNYAIQVVAILADCMDESQKIFQNKYYGKDPVDPNLNRYMDSSYEIQNSTSALGISGAARLYNLELDYQKKFKAELQANVNNQMSKLSFDEMRSLSEEKKSEIWQTANFQTQLKLGFNSPLEQMNKLVSKLIQEGSLVPAGEVRTIPIHSIGPK